jgi:hypothetical protein
MNQRSRQRNKERNKYAKLKNMVLESTKGLDPINIPNCNGSCIDASDDVYWGTTDKSHQIEKLALYKKQRIERGFDDTELWSLDRTIAKYVLPRLVEFKKVVNGYPPEFDKLDDWMDVIDKMIYSFDHIVNCEKYDDELDNELGTDWVGYFETKKLPDGNYELVHGENYNEELMNTYHKRKEEETARIQEGLDLFGKYFCNLWW